MTEILKLRPYQSDMLAATAKEFEQGVKRTAVVMATGTGKTVLFAHEADRYLRQGTGLAVLILVHRDELAEQAEGKLRDVATGFRVGVVKAARNDVMADVIIGSVQTLMNPARLAQLRNVGLVIVDEAHHAAAKSYIEIMTALGCFDEDRVCRAIGVTATLKRTDRKGLGDVWQTVAGEPYDILRGIKDGYLSDVVGQLVTVDGLTLSEVPVVGGDLSAGTLSELLQTSNARRFVVDAYTEHARDMPGIVFVPNVASVFSFTEAFADAGYNVAAVWGDMDIDDRRRILAEYREGLIQVVVNCDVLTEGFDAPRTQCVVIARPTKSEGKYQQMVGRGLRTVPGKGRALVLDVVGATEDHRLCSLVDLSTTRKLTEIKPGESLREAVEREVKRRNPIFADYVISTDEVDLFNRSRAAWLQTYDGVWFLPIMNAAVFLWPGKDDRYRVGIRPVNRSGGRWVREDLALEAALSWGEQAAEEYAKAWRDAYPNEDRKLNTERRASWRRQPATLAQRNLAARIGVVVPASESIKRGELSDMINIHKVSGVLDNKIKTKV